MVLSRSLVAEALGTAFLLAAIVGSGIMAERLAGGNVAIALLCNSVATGAMLVVLITILGPVSGAHLNPAVTLAFLLRHSISTEVAAAYVSCQIAGAVLGTWVAHAMFWRSDLSSFDQSTRGTKPVVRRGCGDLRAHSGNPWYTSVETG